MLPINDQTCGWLKGIPLRPARSPLTKALAADWVIVGAGYTGLSAARVLSQLRPNDRIVIIDACKAGEGASSRNSGYLVDSTLNDGHLSDSGLESFLSKYRLNKLGKECVRDFVNYHRIDCDWNECGKFHATALEQNEDKLHQFSSTLTNCGIAHDVMTGHSLSRRLGTHFYRAAVYTNGGVLLHPAKLARGMIEHLPFSVDLFENTPVMNWHRRNKKYEIITPRGRLLTDNILFCTNGFLSSMGIKTDRAFPLTLTASFTRPLNDQEFSAIGSPDEWGVLSAQAMGATVRLTQDRRIMIRNTAEALKPINMTEVELAKRKKTHLVGLLKRFPFLESNCITHTWSGVTAVSQNNMNILDRIGKGLFVAGCYNGGGIGLATLFGEQLAYKAVGESTRLLEEIEAREKPTRFPPQPFLRWGVKTRLMKDRISASKER